MPHLCPTCGASIPVPESATSGSVRCERCGATSEIKAGLGTPSPASFSLTSFPQTGFLPVGYPPAGFAPPPNPYQPNPYQPPNPWADAPYGPGYFRPPDRNRALAKVQGPGILMQVYSGLIVLSGIGLGILAPFAFLDKRGDDGPVVGVFLGVFAILCLTSGVFIFWAAMRMKALRSYGLALSAVIFTFLVGFLACLPLMLVGIWPLIVLLDAEVKACFDQPLGYK